MSDEEFGRAWAEQQGRAPESYSGRWAWSSYGVGPNRLPELVFAGITGDRWFSGVSAWYDSEAAAYAALGAAVRAVHAAVPLLRRENPRRPGNAGGGAHFPAASRSTTRLSLNLRGAS